MSSEGVKSTFWPGQIFEALGIKYMGPIDGHDLPGLINMLAEIKHVDAPDAAAREDRQRPGLRIAANEPTKFHSPAAFQVERLPGRDQKEQRQIVDHRICRCDDRPGQE